jgi:hypothetical protein
MADRTPILQYETLTFSGASELTFTVPKNVVSLAFQVTAGTVVRRNVTGEVADGWTVQNGLPQGFDMRSLQGEVMYFNSSGDATMEINWVTGLAS